MPFPEMQHFSGFLKKGRTSAAASRSSTLSWVGIGLSSEIAARPRDGCVESMSSAARGLQDGVSTVGVSGKTSTSTPAAK